MYYMYVAVLLCVCRPYYFCRARSYMHPACKTVGNTFPISISPGYVPLYGSSECFMMLNYKALQSIIAMFADDRLLTSFRGKVTELFYIYR